MITYEQAERLQRFRKERFSAIRSTSFVLADEREVPFQSGPKAVLHLVPVGALAPVPDVFEMAPLAANHIDSIGPITSATGVLQRQNTFEGIRTYALSSKTNAAYKYSLWLRTGAVEDVHVFGEASVIRLDTYEAAVRNQLRLRIDIMGKMQIVPPIVLTLSLIDASGKGISGNCDWGTYPIDRNELVGPSLVIRDYDTDPTDRLHLAFEAICNAAGVGSPC